jgi:hypothetical protein
MALVYCEGWLMNKSFAARLEALERLETQAERDRSPLTDEDRRILCYQLACGNVTMQRCWAARTWALGAPEATNALDTALSRLNVELNSLVPRLHTTEALDDWLCEIPDVATLDDRAVLAEAFYGLVQCEGWMPLLTFRTGALTATQSAGAWARYWGRIADRAGVLLQGAVIFPLSAEDTRAALELLDAGTFKVRPFGRAGEWGWRSHHWTLSAPYNGGIVNDTHRLYQRVVHAFDEYIYQVGGTPLETVEDIRAVLVRALENNNHESVEETM